MIITCGPDSDLRTIIIELPEHPTRLGVLVSGGIDSAIMYYLLHLENQNTGNRHGIFPLSIMRKEGSKYFAQGVVNRVHELCKLPKVNTIIVGDNTLPEEEQVKSAVIQAHRQGIDVVYCGVIEQLQQHMVNWHPIPSRETNKFKTPLQTLNKGHIIDLCVKLQQEHLFDITHSCSVLEIGRCNECNGCNERSWGFEQTNVIDTGCN
jgi:hypothetical protein